MFTITMIDMYHLVCYMMIAGSIGTLVGTWGINNDLV